MSNSLQIRWLFWLPAVILATTIFLLSAQSTTPEIGPDLPGFDKLNHFLAYALLGGLVIFPLRRAHKLPLPKTIMLAILITSIYGFTDELHQRFVPQRTCDLWDWAADTVGGVFAASLLIAYETIRSRKKNR